MFDKAVKIIAAAVLLVAVDIIFEVNFPVVREVNLATEKLNKGKEISLLQISDFHGSTSLELIQRLIREAGRVKPDAVLITGDLADQSTRDFNNIYVLIDELNAICSDIFFVSGNHEWNNGRKKELLRKLESLGVVLLNNKGCTFAVSGTNINICGVDDPYRGKDNIEKAMKGVDGSRYTVLLSHSPQIRNRLGSYVPDLILCGHTHGGQIRLPFIGALIAPGEGVLPKFDKGKFILNNGSLLYIDSGVGTSKLPVRLLNRSQVSVIRLRGTGK